MKEKFKKVLSSKIFIYILLAVIIIAQAVYISCVFAFQKEGFHSDEMYSYGLSNSHEDPFLTIKGYVFSGENKNVNEWISGKELKDYLVVNDGEAFDYANVWYNQSFDRHPPFYYSVLHTVCSFFPNQFSPWFGLSVNLAVFIVLQIFLFLLAKRLFKSRWLAVLVCLCFGFSIGATNMFIYTRMYAMLTMWVVIMAYLHIRLLDENSALKLKSLVPLTIIVMLGALTQHEFTLAAFIFAVCFCLRYLCKKQIKNFFKYGISMALGVALAWATFPPLMSQIFSETNNTIDINTAIIQVRISFDYIFKDIFGILGLSDGGIVYYSIIIPTFIVVLILFALPICFLFRKNKKFIAAKLRIKNGFKNFPEKIKSFRPIKLIKSCLCRINFIYWPMILASVLIIVVTAKSNLFISMGYCDRYLFVIYPFAVLIVMGMVICILSKIKPLKKAYRVKIAATLIFVGLLVNCVVSFEPSYLFQNKSIGNLREITADSECIIVEATDDSKWRLICFASELMDTDKIFYTNHEEIEKYKNELTSIKTDKSIYLVLSKNIYDLYEHSADEVIEEYFEGLDFCDINNAQMLGEITIHESDYYVYRLQ